MWGFGTITNSSDQILNIDYAVPANGQITGDQLNSTRGNAIIEIGSLGAIYLTDIGGPVGPHSWGVQIQWNANTANWGYEGGGVLDVQVNADGTFALSGQGQVIKGNINEDASPPLLDAGATSGTDQTGTDQTGADQAGIDRAQA